MTVADDLFPERAEDITEDRVTEPSRRRFLHHVALGGVSVTIGGAMIPLAGLWSPAYAQADANKSVAAFVESVELASVNAYGAAAKTGKITGEALTLAKTFAFHHQAHAHALGTFVGDAAKAQPNPKLSQSLTTMIDNAPDQQHILTVLYGMENAAAATYLVAIGTLSDGNALKTSASILPVESQHAVALGQTLGLAPGDNTGTYMPAFLSTSAAVPATQYPIASGT